MSLDIDYFVNRSEKKSRVISDYIASNLVSCDNKNSILELQKKIDENIKLLSSEDEVGYYILSELRSSLCRLYLSVKELQALIKSESSDN